MRLVLRRTSCCVVYAAVFMAMASVGTLLADTPSLQITSPEKTGKRLPEPPPLATVSSRDNSGETWQVEGSLRGSVPLAVSDFKLAFQRQGWRLDKVITLKPNQQVLLLWKRNNISMILMLSETSVAKTRFAMGLDDGTAPAGKTLDKANTLSKTRIGLKPKS